MSILYQLGIEDICTWLVLDGLIHPRDDSGGFPIPNAQDSAQCLAHMVEIGALLHSTECLTVLVSVFFSVIKLLMFGF